MRALANYNGEERKENSKEREKRRQMVCVTFYLEEDCFTQAAAEKQRNINANPAQAHFEGSQPPKFECRETALICKHSELPWHAY